MAEPVVSITDTFKGILSPTELLKSVGTIQFGVPGALITGEGYIVLITHDEFKFIITFGGGELFFQRNDQVLLLSKEELEKFYLYPFCHVVVGWTTTNLLLGIWTWEKNGPMCVRELPTPPTRPPQSLINWVRKKSLQPIDVFETKEEFYARVFHALGSVEDKIKEMHNPNSFWDFEYDGNKIVARSPKKERDLHPIIYSLLSDHFFLSSIEIISEFKTAIGNLDFLITGQTRQDGLAKVCVEFKNLHSKDVAKGIQEQLPRYMESSKCEIGCYCVFDFRGDWFDLPKEENVLGFTALVTAASYNAGSKANPFAIQFYSYKVGKLASASK